MILGTAYSHAFRGAQRFGMSIERRRHYARLRGAGERAIDAWRFATSRTAEALELIGREIPQRPARMFERIPTIKISREPHVGFLVWRDPNDDEVALLEAPSRGAKPFGKIVYVSDADAPGGACVLVEPFKER